MPFACPELSLNPPPHPIPQSRRPTLLKLTIQSMAFQIKGLFCTCRSELVLTQSLSRGSIFLEDSRDLQPYCWWRGNPSPVCDGQHAKAVQRIVAYTPPPQSFMCLVSGCCGNFTMGWRGPCPRPAALVHVGPMPSDTTGTVHRPGRDGYLSTGDRAGFCNGSPARSAKTSNEGEPP